MSEMKFSLLFIPAFIALLCASCAPTPPAHAGNSLGMQFVPVKAPDEKAHLVSIWETRVADYSKFLGSLNADEARAHAPMPYRRPPPHLKSISQHPVIGISHQDAQAFCDWLTREERAKGTIGQRQRYRLLNETETKLLNENKNHASQANVRQGDLDSYDRDDSASPYTLPVGSFAADSLGLFDVEGNALEIYEVKENPAVCAFFGDSFATEYGDDPILSLRAPKDQKTYSAGFRVVLDQEPWFGKR